ncbi:MAG: hypothetical protein LBD31_05185 [Treponema sp.]|nr:hypothetical protein [Treponema sp.]
MIDFLIQIIKSWEIITVTVVLIFYFYLVFYVTRTHHPPRNFPPRSRAHKKEKAPVEPVPEGSDDEDLGIEED